ncbi:Conserved_hypothetical protein [Hexamita inflata]|uniref:Uncharacterized protein n=1 Tax=Hexamita inflata TaxID=28002 RepID=A0AA86QH96_9EUKA|nr:Conserved hypothetical protein [Hexamita inflata]
MQKQKISTSVLTLVDQLNSKLQRLNSEIETQERITRQLDAQLATLRYSNSQTTDDLKRANIQLEIQKQQHQSTLSQTQTQARSADQYQLELAQRKKERTDVQILIEKQKEQFASSQAAHAKYLSAIEEMEKKCAEQRRKKEELEEANEELIGDINKTGRNVQQLQVKNKMLVEELDQLRRKLVQ